VFRMRMYDLILKKRKDQALTTEEINYIIEGYTEGSIPDYQVSALLMAIVFKGLDQRETYDLTMAMAKSGDMLDLSAIEGLKVDKHSTGGVGDKTSSVLGPMVAACGVPVAKMSGRGLGHTGGTIDKLESFDNFTVDITEEEFFNNVNDIKIAIAGQTANLAPADKKLYALRDVTATVDSIPLIAGSIMSKKLASGADAIVLDVKVGSGAFMKNDEEAFALAKEMVSIGTMAGRDTVAVISNMDQPLGVAVGNANEIKEAIDTLKGHGPKDLVELCLTLGGHMLLHAKKVETVEAGKEMLQKTISDGSALEKFKEFVKAQHGDETMIDAPDKLPDAKHTMEIKAEEDGYVSSIHTEKIGVAAMLLGAGRETKESTIDLGVGISVNKKVGDKVSAGDALVTFYYNADDKLEEAKATVLEAYKIENKPVESLKTIRGIVTKDGIERF
jgi:pyrimidine-nucleoside phosphorylase